MNYPLKTMPNNLFERINNESVIKIVPSNDLGKPGYRWRWHGTKSNVFNSQEEALIRAINYLDESYFRFCPKD